LPSIESTLQSTQTVKSNAQTVQTKKCRNNADGLENMFDGNQSERNSVRTVGKLYGSGTLNNDEDEEVHQ
jgi:hypothetical protein